MRWLCGKADEKTSCWRKSLWYVFYAGLRVGIPKHESLSASPWRPYWIDLIGWNGAKDWPWPWLRFSILLSAIWRLKNVAASPFFFLISYFPRFLIGWISFFMMMTWIYSTCCILIGCWEKVSKKYQETETTIGSTWESLKEQKALHTKWWRNLGWVCDDHQSKFELSLPLSPLPFLSVARTRKCRTDLHVHDDHDKSMSRMLHAHANQ